MSQFVGIEKKSQHKRKLRENFSNILFQNGIDFFIFYFLREIGINITDFKNKLLFFKLKFVIIFLLLFYINLPIHSSMEDKLTKNNTENNIILSKDSSQKNQWLSLRPHVSLTINSDSHAIP